MHAYLRWMLVTFFDPPSVDREEKIQDGALPLLSEANAHAY